MLDMVTAGRWGTDFAAVPRWRTMPHLLGLFSVIYFLFRAKGPLRPALDAEMAIEPERRRWSVWIFSFVGVTWWVILLWCKRYGA